MRVVAKLSLKKPMHIPIDYFYHNLSSENFEDKQ